jgi:hypothetical protein
LRREQLAVISALLTVACVVPYLRDIRRGSTHPQRASWFVFAALSIIAAAAQTAAGAGPGAWLAAGSALGFTLVFVASLRHGVGGSSPWDRAALLIATVGVIVSVVTARPVVAVLAVITAEVAAIGLTVRKTVDDPASETVASWRLDCLAGLVAVAAVTDMTASELLYPIHHTVANAAVLVAIVLGNQRSANSPPTPVSVTRCPQAPPTATTRSSLGAGTTG